MSWGAVLRSASLALFAVSCGWAIGSDDDDSTDEFSPFSGCGIERWPGPTEVSRSYSCAVDEARARCRCDGEEHWVDGPFDWHDIDACQGLIESVCGVPSDPDFCQIGEDTCWGESSPFECLCADSQELVPAEGEDCYAALNLECNGRCWLDDGSDCVDDGSGLWHCTCEDESEPDTSDFSLEDSCWDVARAVCFRPVDSCDLVRWPGPTEPQQTYQCAYDGSEARCDCDGEEVTHQLDTTRIVDNVCLRVIAIVCGARPTPGYCQDGEDTCWGELSPFECLCRGSDELVSVEVGNCPEALVLGCNNRCTLTDGSECVDDGTGLWHCTCGDGAEPDTSEFSLEDRCWDVIGPLCGS